MIEIVQAGQAGKTSLLFDMHRLRARVFKDILNWNVNVTGDGLEVDPFDLPSTVYLLALNDDRRVIGSWRMLPSTGPTMIREVWPQYLESLAMPEDANVWEVSRFSVHSPVKAPEENAHQVQRAIGEMFCGLTELCMACGITDIFTLYDERIAKVIKRINCAPYRTSAHLPIDGALCQVGAFKTDADMLKRLQQATGITESVIEGIEMPEMIKQRMTKQQRR